MQSNYLVDSHCHLNFPELISRTDEVLKNADKAGVKVLQTICTKISEFEEVYKIANDHAPVYASVGIHPHEADKEMITLEELVEFASRPKVIGIGETGLDYFYEHSKREAQKERFLTHIAASRQTGLPLIIHTRDADEDTIAILKAETAKGAFPFLIHCFTATQELADVSLELGGYISISGIVTFKKATELQEVVKGLPLDRILVETDSPFLAPVPHRGKPCEPAYTRNTAEFVAQLQGCSFEEVMAQTTDNFFSLFTKAKRLA